MARSNQSGRKASFFGKGMTKAPRRSHAQARGRRKQYAYVRKDQWGTPIETYIRSNYELFDKQGNAYLDKNGGKFAERISTKKDMPIGSMQLFESSGNLNKGWSSLFSRHHGSTLRDFIVNKNMRTSHAKASAKDLFMVSFGADPKSR